MSTINEYKGEKVISQLTARLIPPNDNYEDCRCELLLTQNHLYVLEDNFNGTWAEHFVFPLSQLTKIEQQVQTGNNANAAKKSSIVATLSYLFLGGAVVSGGGASRKQFLHVSFQNMNGKEDTIFFEDLESSAIPFEKAFIQLKENAYA